MVFRVLIVAVAFAFGSCPAGAAVNYAPGEAPSIYEPGYLASAPDLSCICPACDNCDDVQNCGCRLRKQEKQVHNNAIKSPQSGVIVPGSTTTQTAPSFHVLTQSVQSGGVFYQQCPGGVCQPQQQYQRRGLGIFR